MQPTTSRLLRTVIFLSLIFLVFGLVRGWFYVSRPDDLDNSKMNVQFTVDTQKVKDDTAKVKNAAAEVGDKVAGEAKQLQHKVANHDTPAPAPLAPDPNNPNPTVK
jgi:hypothetical protein